VEVGVADSAVVVVVLEEEEHREAGSMKTSAFLGGLDDSRISAAIGEAEAKTSGEIRIFVGEKEVADPLAEAERQFLRLGMEKTRERNGVLIYFAPLCQSFAVVGDVGVHQKCGCDFWKHITEQMTPFLKGGQYTEAVLIAVREVGAALAKNFPPRGDDRNELSNEVARE
jgi:uncharacterized membrane protein